MQLVSNGTKIVKITTKWQQKQTFIATTEQGAHIVMDGGGGAVSPMQLILAAIGGCSSIDVVMILEKSRQKITDCCCEVVAQRADSSPRVFTKINAHYIISGQDLSDKAVQRACELSIEKYCSVALMLNQSVEITFSYQISEN